MRLELNDHQRTLQREAIAFAEAHLREGQIERDREERFDRDRWKACADFGVLGMPIPEEHGGSGLPIGDMIAIMEGLGYGACDQGLLFSVNAHLWTAALPILEYGTTAQKARYLPGLTDGTLIGGNAASEPGSGSDVFSLTTRAEKRGDDYVLNGAKTFITNAPVADLLVVYATIDAALGAMGVTAFIVPTDTPGLTIGRPIEKMGLRTSPMAEVILEDCVVPAAQRLGREGRGANVFNCSMEWERGCILASCLGVMRRLLERCVEHARARKQFGQAIGKFQAVAHRIVDMKLRLETARPLVYRIGELKGTGRPAATEAALAKLYVSEAYVKSCLDAVQVFGGYGFMTEYELEREVRNAVGSTLYSGTSEIQRNLIARGLGL